MNNLSRYKTILYLCAVFVTGLIAGGAIGYGFARRSIFRPPTEAQMARHILADLQQELQLTPTQVGQISPVIEKAAREIQGVHERTFTEVREIIQKTDKEMANFLTPEQKKLLEQMHERRERKKYGGPPPGPRRPPHETGPPGKGPPPGHKPPPDFGPPPSEPR